ncbi:hypothetical protein MTBBW1_2130078 [Desulfamplus magnetovallimortis]|uniref:Uncharacterized protein n=1 Tax=Desulfamplus magnetovallimortis TaxID=1246637 RepID=A0A1W1HCL7_9BACT|nr:hypothetical protein MTBBW1_2130078 [Desulfamplus magnetovallimortis]
MLSYSLVLLICADFLKSIKSTVYQKKINMVCNKNNILLDILEIMHYQKYSCK